MLKLEKITNTLAGAAIAAAMLLGWLHLAPLITEIF